MKILVTGGGTGGHVFPGLAVADALRTLDPGSGIRFAGTARGLEARLVPGAGWPFDTVSASGVRGLGWGARLRFLANLAVGTIQALGIIFRHRPDVVLGTGGYVSVPVMLAARLTGRPIAVQEQNSVPGSTNRLVGRWARRVYLGFAEAADDFPAGVTVHTGNPVRRDVAAALGDGPPEHWDGQRPLRVLSVGGSRGARSLNDALCQAAPLWLEREDLELWLQTGTEDHARVSLAYGDAFERWRGTRRLLRVEPFVEDMPAALQWADLVVCRAGAMTLAELAVAGKPAVLVPFPHATDDHQARNALGVAKAGAAEVMPDDMCTGEALTAMVDTLKSDPDALAAMARASLRLARPDAAMDIALDLMRLTGDLPPAEERS